MKQITCFQVKTDLKAKAPLNDSQNPKSFRFYLTVNKSPWVVAGWHNLNILLIKWCSLQKNHDVSAAELGSDPSYPLGGFSDFKDTTRTWQGAEYIAKVLVSFCLPSRRQHSDDLFFWQDLWCCSTSCLYLIFISPTDLTQHVQTLTGEAPENPALPALLRAGV